MKYRKRPIEVEAFQWDGTISGNVINTSGMPKWFQQAYEKGEIRFAYEDWQRKGHLTIYTLEGKMQASPGDYIIRGIKGEIYPCKPDIFEATYEPTV